MCGERKEAGKAVYTRQIIIIQNAAKGSIAHVEEGKVGHALNAPIAAACTVGLTVYSPQGGI